MDYAHWSKTKRVFVIVSIICLGAVVALGFYALGLCDGEFSYRTLSRGVCGWWR